MKLLLAPEAAQILRITPNRLYDLMKRGIVPCVRIGRQVRLREDELLTWIEAGGTGDLSEETSSPLRDS